ncbi:MAG: hypothetical protein Q7J55_01330 [bacterium]|nr:hypothetical protein [bacterium]
MEPNAFHKETRMQTDYNIFYIKSQEKTRREKEIRGKGERKKRRGKSEG